MLHGGSGGHRQTEAFQDPLLAQSASRLYTFSFSISASPAATAVNSSVPQMQSRKASLSCGRHRQGQQHTKVQVSRSCRARSKLQP